MQNRSEDDPDQYWVGRALRIKKVFEEVGSVGRVRQTSGVRKSLAIASHGCLPRLADSVRPTSLLACLTDLEPQAMAREMLRWRWSGSSVT